MRAEGCQGLRLELLPHTSGAQKEGRESTGGGRPGSVRAWSLHPQSG
jgi:hypothetical protein